MAKNNETAMNNFIKKNYFQSGATQTNNNWVKHNPDSF